MCLSCFGYFILELMLFFFFQAEDGIRDYKVTGVQTCALPILPRIILYHTAHEPRAVPPVLGFRTAAGGGIERAGYRALGATRLVTDLCVISFARGGPR